MFTNPRPSPEELPSYYESKDYISHSDENKGLLSIVYQQARKYALAQKFKLLKHLPAGSKILDYGCGTGNFLHYCKQHGLDTLGIEPNTNARNTATQLHKLRVEEENYVHKLEPSSFDAITLWHVLEHVPLLQERFATLVQALKPGGLLIIALPNANSWDAHYYKEFWAAYDVPRHLYHFAPASFRRLIQNFPLEFIRQEPMKLDAYYISLLSEKYKSGNSGYLDAFLKGWKSNADAKSNLGNYSSLIYILKKK
ncbi:MAG: class I SAM-dependent methyltransferase [Bacteroidota bacterium]